MDAAISITTMIGFSSATFLIIFFSCFKLKEKEETEIVRRCKLCGDRREHVCSRCDNGWCKFDFKEDRDIEHLDYYFVNRISRHCKKCRAPELVIEESKLKKPICFSCIQGCIDDSLYQCEKCRRTFCEYHAKLTEYENGFNPNWQGECTFCLDL